VRAWVDVQADSAKITVDADPFQNPTEEKNEELRKESVRRGLALFQKGDASCISCHLDYGRQNTFRYDDWGTVVRPRNLTDTNYRGGRRPIDLYYRIHQGINGTPMSAYYNKAGNKTPDQWNREIWDLINFVQALPYPQMLPEDVREQIYPPSKEVKVTAHD
jgi:mono/diheme cytochrome c family protein